MKHLFCYLLFSITIISPIFSVSDKALVNKIASLVIEDYQKYKDRSPLEKIVLKLGKNAFITSVKDWEKNYSNLSTMKIKLYPRIDKMVFDVEKIVNEEDGKYFRGLLERLTMLGYLHLQLDYLAVKDYLAKYPQDEIDIGIIDEAVTEPVFFKKKTEMYDEEFIIKANILKILERKEVKKKLWFELFAYKFLIGIRNGIIKKTISKMAEKTTQKDHS